MCPLILGWGTTLSALYMREEGATEAHVTVGQARAKFQTEVGKQMQTDVFLNSI